jgi:hypothetical protein
MNGQAWIGSHICGTHQGGNPQSAGALVSVAWLSLFETWLFGSSLNSTGLRCLPAVLCDVINVATEFMVSIQTPLVFVVYLHRR